MKGKGNSMNNNQGQWEHISLKCKPEDKEVIIKNAKSVGMSVNKFLLIRGMESGLPAKRAKQIIIRNAAYTQQVVNFIRKEVHKQEPDRDEIEKVLKKLENISWEN